MKCEQIIKKVAAGALLFLILIVGFCFWGLKRIDRGESVFLPESFIEPIVAVSFVLGMFAAIFYVGLVVKAFWDGLKGSEKGTKRRD